MTPAPAGFVVGIDIGGTGSRAAIAPLDGAPRFELDGPRVAVTADGSTAGELARGLLAGLREARPAEFAAVVGCGIGATGLASLVADPAGLAVSLRAEFAPPRPADAPAPAVAVAIDAVTAHLGALGGESGAIIALGTGAIAFGSDGHEIWHRVDGWGHLLGDRGGGAWIGRRALEAALLAHDGVDASGSALLAAARARFGEPAGWPAQLYTRDDRAGVLAGFVPDVVALAADGDGAALAIVSEAGAEAARSAAAALVPGLAPRVAATGGLFGAGGALAERFRETLAELRPDAELRAPLGDPLDGALRLAERAARGELVARAPSLWLA
ncbi:BadF/BadG/BcrA/BcrD ATPase family protein [Agromyces soli]|uniref:ATPase BadF/BadG/BcrA/BcrD type domain-containing protein n=1 Tax=Agromyces soli TaxID=659012 RepID=A0ABY4AZ91_9MICO|nr:BadF/BadG/BcrA/BcrD ATPase family protein [Agromyces soli]UOE27742.1 hypothetical protein MTP13_08185 [Agromyces soli]